MERIKAKIGTTGRFMLKQNLIILSRFLCVNYHALQFSTNFFSDYWFKLITRRDGVNWRDIISPLGPSQENTWMESTRP